MQQSSGLFTIALLTIFFVVGWDLYTLWESNIASEHGSF